MSLAPVNISTDPVDEFLKFKNGLEAQEILHDLFRIDFLNFGLDDFCFQLEFFFSFEFRCIKPT